MVNKIEMLVWHLQLLTQLCIQETLRLIEITTLDFSAINEKTFAFAKSFDLGTSIARGLGNVSIMFFT